MRVVLLCAALTLPAVIHAQAAAPASPGELYAALRGDWVGVLEYRDYSEPVGSTKRVDLPTWLTVRGDGPLQWHYVYDDGPAKVVTEDDGVAFDAAAGTYTVTPAGKAAQVMRVTGLDGLKGGRGTLEMTAAGVDSGKPSERHTVLTVRRNLMEILEEVRPAGSTEPFAFRHLYRMVRAAAPAIR